MCKREPQVNRLETLLRERQATPPPSVAKPVAKPVSVSRPNPAPARIYQAQALPEGETLIV